MKFLAIFIILLPFLAEARTKIMVSYFKPFGGAPENHTKAVAIELKKHPDLKDFDVILCPIDESLGVDVSFYSPRTDLEGVLPLGNKLAGETSAFQQIKMCLVNNPDVSSVYSLGEGTCKVTYENVAYNAMATGNFSKLADQNKNIIPTVQIIDLKGPQSVLLDNYKNIDAFCLAKLSNPGFEDIAQVGTDPGTYTCNNHAYNMQRYIQENQLPVSFDFVHIPVNYGQSKFCSIPSKLESIPEAERKKALTTLVADNLSKFVKSKNLITQRSKAEECTSQDIVPEIPHIELLIKSPDMKACIEETRKYVELNRIRNEQMRIKPLLR